jgi:hypothetical protein
MKERWKGCLRNRRRIGHRIGAHRTIAGMPGAFVLELGQIHTSCAAGIAECETATLTDAHANIKLGELFVGRVGAQRFPIFGVTPFPFCQDRKSLRRSRPHQSVQLIQPPIPPIGFRFTELNHPTPGVSS